jgi:hypothetical protein
MVEIKLGELTEGIRVSRPSPARASRWSTAASSWWSPGWLEVRTRWRRGRRTRELDRWCRNLPVVRPKGGWRRRRPRVSTTCSFRCEIRRFQGFSGCGEGTEEYWGRREGRGYSTKLITEEIRRRVLCFPVSNLTEMVAARVLDPEGDGRGGYGVFTEGFKRARGLLEGEWLPAIYVNREGEEISGRRTTVLTSGSRLQGERGERWAGWAGSGGCWAVAWLGPGCSPVTGFLYFFCSVTFFYFLFSISFIDFAYCIQIKPNQFLIFSKFK